MCLTTIPSSLYILGMWTEVEILLTKMVKNNMVLNQSVLSSVINVCRVPPISVSNANTKSQTGNNAVTYTRTGV